MELLPMQPTDATFAVSVLVLLQQAALSAHGQAKATRSYERFAEAAEVAGEAARPGAEDRDAGLLGVPVSLLAAAVDGPAGKLLGPQVSSARAALARETDFVRSAEARRQVARHVREANGVLSQPKVNDTVVKIVGLSGAWLQPELLMQQARGKSSSGDFLKELKDALAESKAPTLVPECKLLIRGHKVLEPSSSTEVASPEDVFESDQTDENFGTDKEGELTEGICNFVQEYTEGFVACMLGKQDYTKASAMIEKLEQLLVKYPTAARKIKPETQVAASIKKEKCDFEFSKDVKPLLGKFKANYRSMQVGTRKDWTNNYASVAFKTGRWNSIISLPPRAVRRNSVYSGFSLKVGIKFTNGWSVAFKPVGFKSLRFDVHDNLPDAGQYLANKDSAIEASDGDVKFWKLDKIWGSREMAPKGGFQYFGVTHPVNERLSLSWSFKRDYIPYPGYAGKLGFKFKEARERDSTKASRPRGLAGDRKAHGQLASEEGGRGRAAPCSCAAHCRASYV